MVRDRNPLPEGTVPVAAGLLVNGIATYAFLVVARRALGDDAYGGLAVLWGLVYILGPGFFQPLEQEVARATANRAAQGQGSAPVLWQAARIGAVEFGLVAVGLLVAWPLGLDHLLDDRVSLLVAMIAALGTFAVAELVRGVMSGRHLFRLYGRYFAVEGLVRLLVALGLAIVGVEMVGPYAMAIAAAFALGVVAMIGSERPFVRPGPHASMRELTPALGLLLATSLSEAFLLNVGPVAMKILSDDEAAPGLLLNGLIISRTPLFFFQAVKAALLPNLAAMAARNDLHGFRALQLRLVGAVTAVAALSVAGMALLGPWLVEMLFGDQLGARDMALLAAGGGGLMIMLSLSLGLVALNHTRLAVLGFFVGVVVFPLALLTANDDFLRVEVALVAAVTAGTLVTAAFLRYEYGVHIAAGRLTARTSSFAGDREGDQR